MRDHELSYFGVQANKVGEPEKLSTPKMTRRTTLSHDEPKQPWHHMSHDKPDLLRHSEPQKPQFKIMELRPAERKSLHNANSEEEHFYENISNELKPTFNVKPCNQNESPYDRKKDHERDERILSEMSRNADQTMKVSKDNS